MANKSTNVPIEDRFWSKVRIDAAPDACWEWQGFCYPTGHGQFCFNGRDIKASRAVWMLYNVVSLCSEDYICHTCDNPCCVRLDHLYKGTHQTNQADKRGKFSYRHENAPYVKLDWNKVAALRALQGACTQIVAAQKFGISPTTVRRVWNAEDRGGWRREVPLNG